MNIKKDKKVLQQRLKGVLGCRGILIDNGNNNILFYPELSNIQLKLKIEDMIYANKYNL